MTILRRTLMILCLLALAACEPAPADPQALPTLLVLPTETPTFTASPETLAPATTSDATVITLTQTPDLLEPSQTQTTVVAQITEQPASAASAETPSATPTGTATSTMAPGVTERPSLTPSMTITDTPTLTATPTPYSDEDLSPLFQLAIVALSSTPPPTGFYVAPSLTPTGFTSQIPGVTPGSPGGNPGGALCLPPPGGLGSVYIADPTLSTQIGCPLGSPLPYPAAVQTFERGIMVYVGTSPAAVYVLYNSGTYSRFADTWVDGIDPVSGGETAPSGLYEPIRGFGKVWRSDIAVRNGLGWATQPETGTTATLLLFQSGQMLALPPLGQVAVMTTTGLQRLIMGTS